MTRRLSAFLVFAALLTLTAWTYQDCVEVDFDHPDCNQYPTTTTSVTYPSTTTTVTVPVTTTTVTTPNETTTTVTQPETFTTQPTTTTTVQECAAGLVHQPPFCVTTTVQFFDTTTTAAVGIGTPLTIEELPMTGDWTALLSAVAGVFLLGGLGLVSRSRKAHE